MTRHEDLSDDALLERVQRQTFRYFWEFAHPVSGLARERSNLAFGYGPEVVTTGGSTIRALEALREEGHQVCGVLAICDRLAGGAGRIEEAAGAPFVALTTIDEVYPERPDR